MTGLTKELWRLLEEQYEKIIKYDEGFVFEKEKYAEFDHAFRDSYEHVKKRYMHPDVEYLDRHKVAALLIICVLEADAIHHKFAQGKIFIGAELLALRAALTYMLSQLNEKLKEHNKKIKRVELPETLSCDMQYIEIMCRNLYHTRNDYRLNPLDIAEKLYLLEQYWLLKASIDPMVLKTNKEA